MCSHTVKRSHRNGHLYGVVSSAFSSTDWKMLGNVKVIANRNASQVKNEMELCCWFCCYLTLMVAQSTETSALEPFDWHIYRTGCYTIGGESFLIVMYQVKRMQYSGREMGEDICWWALKITWLIWHRIILLPHHVNPYWAS